VCWIQIQYIHRSFLSDKGSKIRKNLNVQNSILHANETGRNFVLKCRGLSLSPVFDVSYIPLKCPVIVCQQTWGSRALVPLFHSYNTSVKSFTVFVTDFTEILWEKIQVWPQQAEIQTRISSHSLVRFQKFLHNILTVRCLWFPNKLL
jgi:hypothetical protein